LPAVTLLPTSSWTFSTPVAAGTALLRLLLLLLNAANASVSIKQ
jgi:hypothetical protein